MTHQHCNPRFDWFGFTAAFAVFAVGSFLTATVIGAVIGIPLVLVSLGPLLDHKTLQGTPCAS